MADIVERLRGLADLFEAQQAPHNIVLHMRAGADEIARLRAGGCARDQSTTQYCAEAAQLAAENEKLRVENIQMRFALGYPMPADQERHILPSNPFKCGMCDARADLAARDAEVARLKIQIADAKEAIDADDVIAAYHILDQALNGPPIPEEDGITFIEQQINGTSRPRALITAPAAPPVNGDEGDELVALREENERLRAALLGAEGQMAMGNMNGGWRIIRAALEEGRT